MPVLCNICTGCLHKCPMDLTEANGNNSAVIALKCGHIFHRYCVRKWFSQGNGNAESGRCPNCQSSCKLAEALTVFPSFDENIDEITAQMEKMKAAKKEIDKSPQKQEVDRGTKELQEMIAEKIEATKSEILQKLDRRLNRISENIDGALGIESSETLGGTNGNRRRKKFLSQADKEKLAHRLREEVHSASSGTGLTSEVKQELKSVPKFIRKEIVSMVDTHDSLERAPLFIASQNGNVGIAQFLIETCGADLEQRGIFASGDSANTRTATPLWVAAAVGKLPVVKLLVQHGAQVNARSDSGSSPLRAACFFGHLEVIRFLVEEAGADISNSNYDCKTPCLHMSTKYPKICEFLLERGAKANAQNVNLDTALHFAVNYGKLESVKVLVAHGADPFLENKRGENAIERALDKDETEIYEALLAGTGSRSDVRTVSVGYIGVLY